MSQSWNLGTSWMGWGPVEWAWDQLTGLGGCTMKRQYQFVLSKLAILALNEPVLEFRDHLNGLRTSWMSSGPVDWVGEMHNEKIVSVRFVKISRFVTRWASTRIWGPVEWIEDQLNGLVTSWMGYNDQSIYIIQNNYVLYLIHCDFGTPNNLFLFNAFLH